MMKTSQLVVVAAFCAAGLSPQFAHSAVKACVRGVPSGIDPAVMSEAYWKIWNEAEQMKIDADIEANRKADGVFAVSAADGTEVEVEQLDHEFRFGAHIFNFNQLGKTEWNDAYKASYGAGGLFNQATVAFYWDKYEPVPGHRRLGGDYEDSERYWNSLSVEEAQRERFWRRPAAGPVVNFLKARDVRIHGHILVWGNAKPYWIYDWYCPESEKRAFETLGVPRHAEFTKRTRAGAEGNFGFGAIWKNRWRDAYCRVTDAELDALAPVFAAAQRRVFRERILGVAQDFGSVIDSWDVVNESSKDWAFYRKSRTGLRFWKSVYGLMPGDYPLDALLDAKEALSPKADLCINDYNISPDFLAQVTDLTKEGAKIDVVGCQMHIFNTNDCARLAAGATDVNWVGTPAVIRERLDMMAKTGRRLHVSEVTISAPGADPKSRAVQAVLARNIYRAWFSHKSTKAITWWNTVDGGGVYGEPLVSGLFTRDLQKKPAYQALDELINREWKTRHKIPAGGGKVAFRGFRGKYRLTWRDAFGFRCERVVYLTGTGGSEPESTVRRVRDEAALLRVGIKPEHFEKPVGEAVREVSARFEDTPVEKAKLLRLADGQACFDLAREMNFPLSEGTDGAYDPAVLLDFPVEMDAAGTVRLCYANNWYGRVFVNGKLVYTRLDGPCPDPTAYVHGWNAVPLALEKGVNRVTFESRHGSIGKWETGLRIER